MPDNDHDYVLREDFQSFRSDVDTRFKSLDEAIRHVPTRADLATNIEASISKIQRDARSAAPQTWLTAGAVVISIAALAAALIGNEQQHMNRRVDRVESETQDNDDRLEARSPQIAKATVEIDHLDGRLKYLDETLQREMRLLDDRTAAELAALDKRLQMEMRLLLDAQSADITAIRERIQRIEQQLDRHLASSADINSSQTERIHAVEREVFSGERRSSYVGGRP